MLGLGSSIVKGGAGAKTIVTDNLVLKHNYSSGKVRQVNTGAASFVRSGIDSVSLGFGTALTPKTTGFTACFWAKTNDLSNAQMALACDNGTNQRMYIGIHLGYWRFGWGDTAWGSGTASATTEWTHIALIHTTSTDTTQMYINGVKDGTRTDTGSGTFNDGTFGGDFVIGKHGASGDITYAWDGYICNAGIWTRTLSQEEVKSIMWKNYANLTSAETTSLVSWYNLDSTMITPVDSDSDGVTQLGTLDSHYGGGSELGSEMWDGANGSHTNWTNFGGGNNTVTASDGAVKITYVDQADGRYIYLKNDHDLNADLVVGKFYRLTFSTKINNASGSVEWKIKEEGEDSYQAGALTSTSFITQQIDFIATSTTDHYLYPSSMDGIEAVWIKDVSLKLINGNHGTLL